MPIPARYQNDPGARIWPRLIATESGCMEWQGSRNEHGYGQLRVDGRLIKAHRFAWELINGPIPAGADLLHSCDNPPCCNPDHLAPGDASTNGRDMSTRGRHGAWAKPERVARGIRHGAAKLTDVDVRSIRAAVVAGESISSLARRFAVSRQTIRGVRDGKNWRHID